MEHGNVSEGKVTVADGSTEPARALCCSLWRVDEVGLGKVCSGKDRLGKAR